MSKHFLMKIIVRHVISPTQLFSKCFLWGSPYGFTLILSVFGKGSPMDLCYFLQISGMEPL